MMIKALMENRVSSEITLRPFQLSDVDDFLSYAGDEKVTRFTRWKTFTSREEALSYIKESCIPQPYCRSICIGDKSIGYVIVKPDSDNGRCRAELGYALSSKFWGQGITTRALKMAIPEGFKLFPEVVRLQAVVIPENLASQKVLEKLGFLREGVLRRYLICKGEIRDLAMYSLLSTDPMP